jgi:hypothetical protein
MLKKKNNYKGILIWIVVTVIIGTFWHFGYELLGKNYVAGLVFPINESVWEHLKIVFYPLLLAGGFAYFTSKPKNAGIWTGTLAGIILGMLAVFFGFYLYSSVIGESLLADIILYVLAIILGMYASWFVATKWKLAKKSGVASVVILIIIAAGLAYLSVRPPKFSPFIEKSSNSYGIDQKSAE